MRNTIPYTLSSIIILASMLLVGCEASDEPSPLILPEMDQTMGKAPMAYPPGTPNDVIIAAARKHLDEVVEIDVNERLFSIIYFNELVPLDQLDEYVEKYDLQGGYQAGIKIVVAEDFKMGIGLTNEQILISQILSNFEENLAAAPIDIRENAGEPQLGGLVVWAFPKQLQKWWSEDSKIRMIGLGGKKGNILGAWTGRMPWEDFR